MPGMAPTVRDPNAMLLHPDYRDFGSHGDTKADIFPKDCIREGHERDLQKGDEGKLQRGHVVSKSTLKLIADPEGKVGVLYTCYEDDGRGYAPAAGNALLHASNATRAPAFCKICERNFKSIDGMPDISRNVDLRRALFEACARNAHHVAWRMLLFNKKLNSLKREFVKKKPSMSELQSVNRQIAELAWECLPPQPDDPIPAGIPLEQDEHFRHFVRHYPETPFRVAVSTEVVLQHEGDPATRTLAFVNVVPQTARRETGKEIYWYTTAALSIPLIAPSIWQTILDNSEHLSDAEHQRIISNLATRSPDGVCFAPEHFSTLDWEAGILPNLLANPLPGLTLPIVNVTGLDLGDLANGSFDLFA